MRVAEPYMQLALPIAAGASTLLQQRMCLTVCPSTIYVDVSGAARFDVVPRVGQGTIMSARSERQH